MAKDERSVFFSRLDGFGGGLQSFYRWNLDSDRVDRTLLEDALYSGCSATIGGLACLRETPLRPSELVLLDPYSGKTELIFNANPEISDHFAGTVERLTWTDTAGVEGYGRLVLPPGYAHDRPLPLVVVQYRPRGFERGGIGDEAPVLPLAEAGYAVLDFNRPDAIDPKRNMPNDDAFMKAAMKGWRDEQDALTSLENGIRRLIARGIVDRAKIGITGLSAGAQTAQFALIHSDLFSAAVLSTCCKDPGTLMATSGPGLRSAQERWGLRSIDKTNAEQWRAVSLAMNVDHIKIPILLQLPEWEFRGSLETVSAFRAHHRALELIIFPGEYHVKDQPAHKLAVYRRTIDWFDFWLRGISHQYSEQSQYVRWKSLEHITSISQ